MEKKSYSVLSPLPNQPTWLAVEGTNWILIKESWLDKEGIYNMRDITTHRPAELSDLQKVTEMILYAEEGTPEFKVWCDLVYRCRYIRYSAVKELEIRDNEIKTKSNAIYNLRNKLVIANCHIKGWKRLALASIIVDMLIAAVLLVYF